MKIIKKSLLQSLMLIVIFMLLIGSCKKEKDEIEYGSMVDQDGNVYKTVTIGNQVWMAENLKTTKFRNGDPIPNVTDSIAWSNLTTGALCAYDNDEDSVITYGYLYNYYAIQDDRNIAPEGWHIPMNEDWKTLIDYLGGITVAPLKLIEEIRYGHWKYADGTNSSGFTARGSGKRSMGLSPEWQFQTKGNSTYFYSFNGYMRIGASYIIVVNVEVVLYENIESPKVGRSLRCIKDN